jgi:hypothetical protein
MHKLLAMAVLFAAVGALSAAPAAASGISHPYGFSGAGATSPELVLVGGMGGGGGGMGGGTAAGMGGGAGIGGNTGGMAGGNGGGMGGGSGGMNGGGFGGNMFGGQTAGFGESAAGSTGSGGQYYTYQCATPVGRCSFVAPAALRDNSLRSGADCACPDGRSRGQVE